MNIVSADFMCFALCTVLLYYIIPKKFRWCIFIVANTLFYIYGGGEMIVYIVAACAIAYFAGRVINSFYEKQKKECAGLDRKEKKVIKQKYNSKRKRVLGISVILVLCGLILTKYSGFLAENINALLGITGIGSINVDNISSFFPVVFGCSYFTLSIVAYITDVYRGKYKAESNFLKLYAFIAFFPHIMQGPIERYDYLAPQLFEARKFKFENIKTGAMLILWGVFKKLVIADRIATVSNYVFKNYQSLNAVSIIFGLAVFSIQIYADWTSYCDIVGGVAEMMGIKITENFRRPYFSKSMPEFWRRWHISMSQFFKDYVLYPISASSFCLKLNKNARKLFGNAAGRVISSALPILAVWFLTGLWHGASWNFMLWGLFQGVVIMLSVIFTPMINKINEKCHFKTDTFGWSLFRMGRTFLICCIGRIFFKAATVSDAFGIFSRLGVLSGGLSITSLGLDMKDWKVFFVALLVLIIVSVMQEKFEVRKKLDEQPIIFKWIVLYLLIMSIVIFGVYGDNSAHVSFIYENF